MERILFNISQVLGITIIHSLWQGLLVYFALRILLTVKISANRKHLFAMLALLTITGWFFYTLFDEIAIYNQQVLDAGNISAMPLMLGLPAGITHLGTQATRYYYSIEQYLPYITIAYAAGLVYNSAMLLVARKRINTIRKTLCADILLEEKVKRFMTALHISKNVKIGLSHLVDVPCITGFIKPVILLPVTLSTSLSAEEIEAILLHELAHVKRNDYLLNLAQQTMRVLLFFNPFAHLTIGIINREREISCDDIVVATSQSPMVYAQALVKLEETRFNPGQLALMATGKKYHLLNRIENIMKPKKSITNTRHVLLTVVLFAIGITSVAWLNPTITNGKISVRNIKPIIEKAIAAISPEPASKPNNSNSPSAISDTTKKHLNKPEPFNADSGNVNTQGYQLFGFNDAELNSLNTEYRRLQKIVDDYFHNPKYLLLEGQVRGYNHPVVQTYDNDTLRNLMTAWHRTADSMRMAFETPTNKRRSEIGKNVGAYFSSDDFKKLNARLQKKYGINPDLKYDEKDPAYQKYQAALKKSTPAGIQQQLDELVSLSREAEDVFESPQYVANFKRFEVLRDSFHNYYKKPHLVQYADTAKTQLTQEEMKKYRIELDAYNNNPEIKHDQELIREDIQKIGDRMKTAEFSQHVQEWKNQLHTVLNKKYDNILHADKKDE